MLDITSFFLPSYQTRTRCLPALKYPSGIAPSTLRWDVMTLAMNEWNNWSSPMMQKIDECCVFAWHITIENDSPRLICEQKSNRASWFPIASWMHRANLQYLRITRYRSWVFLFFLRRNIGDSQVFLLLDEVLEELEDVISLDVKRFVVFVLHVEPLRDSQGGKTKTTNGMYLPYHLVHRVSYERFSHAR